MPLQKLTYRAGINREGTDYSNEGGFYDGDKVRFRSGQAEKIGSKIQTNYSSIWIDYQYDVSEDALPQYFVQLLK